MFQVTYNDTAEERLNVHWFQPSLSSLQRGNVYHSFNFQEENEQVHIRSQQRGARRIRLDPRTDYVPYQSVHFGFTCLPPGLPPEVLRELRSLSLITGFVRGWWSCTSLQQLLSLIYFYRI